MDLVWSGDFKVVEAFSRHWHLTVVLEIKWFCLLDAWCGGCQHLRRLLLLKHEVVHRVVVATIQHERQQLVDDLEERCGLVHCAFVCTLALDTGIDALELELADFLTRFSIVRHLMCQEVHGLELECCIRVVLLEPVILWVVYEHV